MRDFLKGLDLEKETIDSIMAEHGKHLTGVKEKNNDLTEEVKTLKDEVDELKKVDIEKVKTENFDLGKTEGSKEVETYKKGVALKDALISSKTKDLDVLSGLIEIDKIEYEQDDKGNFKVKKGLEEQLKSIKEKKEYLFEKETEKNDTAQKINLGGSHDGGQPKNEPTSLKGALKEKYEG